MAITKFLGTPCLYHGWVYHASALVLFGISCIVLGALNLSGTEIYFWFLSIKRESTIILIGWQIEQTPRY